jgi:hypothetical protein
VLVYAAAKLNNVELEDLVAVSAGVITWLSASAVAQLRAWLAALA